MNLVDDLLPGAFSIKLPGKELSAEALEGVVEVIETSGKSDGSYHSRNLDSDEKTGVWTLLGIFASSWILGGILAPRPSVAETEHHDKPVPEKAAETH